MSGRASPGHLARRFAGAISSRPPCASDVAWVRDRLSDREMALWSRLGVADQRHSIDVAHRFAAAMPDAPVPAVAAALLHDIGKLESSLGVMARVVATVVGPRTARFRAYHDHERIGAEMLAGAGSSPTTIALVAGTSEDAATADALQHADDI